MSQTKISNIKNYFERQYKFDLFSKLDFPFEEGKSILDAGCGDGINSDIFTYIYGLNVTGIDVYKHENIDKFGIAFQISSVLDLPFSDDCFDYVYIQDVLHHIDEQKQSKEKHLKALSELKRVVKPGGKIIIVEANRYNPLFYPHMVKYLGHNHFHYDYYINLINEAFLGLNVQHKSFEAHFYFSRILWFWKIYENIMERFSPKRYKAYNVSIIEK